MTSESLLTVRELAAEVGKPASLLIKKLFSWGLCVTANQTLDADTIEALRSALATPQPAIVEGEREAVASDYSEQALADRQIDFLEARADEWMAETGVQRMFNAIASVFESHAPQEIMDRFREKLGVIGRQCHVEGALRVWEEISAQQRALGRNLPADQTDADAILAPQGCSRTAVSEPSRSSDVAGGAQAGLIEALEPFARAAGRAETMPDGSFLWHANINGDFVSISKEDVLRARTALLATTSPDQGEESGGR